MYKFSGSCSRLHDMRLCVEVLRFCDNGTHILCSISLRNEKMH